MTQHATPTQVLARRVRDVRGRQTLSASGLAERCADLGMPDLNRDVIANIENRRRASVSVDELFVLARALGVAPIHLIVPVYDDEQMAVTPTDTTVARAARSWAIGDAPLGGDAEDVTIYWTDAPYGWRHRHDEHRRQIETRTLRAVDRAIGRATRDDGTIDAKVLDEHLLASIGSI